MKPRRKHISFRTKYAAALRIDMKVDYDFAKQLNEEEFLAVHCPGIEPWRRHPWKAMYAIVLCRMAEIPRSHSESMHVDQLISLFELHHDIQHGNDPINDYWNLTPMLKPEHKARFRKDNAAVKKVTRILRKAAERKNPTKRRAKIPARVNPWPKGRKIQSRNTLARGKKHARPDH